MMARVPRGTAGVARRDPWTVEPVARGRCSVNTPSSRGSRQHTCWHLHEPLLFSDLAKFSQPMWIVLHVNLLRETSVQGRRAHSPACAHCLGAGEDHGQMTDSAALGWGHVVGAQHHGLAVL